MIDAMNRGTTKLVDGRLFTCGSPVYGCRQNWDDIQAVVDGTVHDRLCAPVNWALDRLVTMAVPSTRRFVVTT